jgi:hypothetical protein
MRWYQNQSYKGVLRFIADVTENDISWNMTVSDDTISDITMLYIFKIDNI